MYSNIFTSLIQIDRSLNVILWPCDTPSHDTEHFFVIWSARRRSVSRFDSNVENLRIYFRKIAISVSLWWSREHINSAVTNNITESIKMWFENSIFRLIFETLNRYKTISFNLNMLPLIIIIMWSPTVHPKCWKNFLERHARWRKETREKPYTFCFNSGVRLYTMESLHRPSPQTIISSAPQTRSQSEKSWIQDCPADGCGKAMAKLATL